MVCSGVPRFVPPDEEDVEEWLMPTKLQKLLRKALAEAGGNLTTLAQDMRLPYSSLFTYLNYGKTPDVPNLRIIAAYLKQPVSHLLGGEDAGGREGEAVGDDGVGSLYPKIKAISPDKAKEARDYLEWMCSRLLPVASRRRTS